MAEYTDVVDLMNQVHKEMGGSYDGDTAVEIVQLAAQYYNSNEQEISTMTRRDLYRELDRVYQP